jgi:hypothetical protein
VRFARRLAASVAAVVLAALLLPGTVAVWVDPEGRTWLTDGTRPAAPAAVEVTPEELTLRFRGNLVGQPVPRASAGPDDRYLREVRTAQEDVERGEGRLGLQRLRRLLAERPERPEAAWLLAQTERQRGRLEAARAALVSIETYASAGPAWHDAARDLAAELDGELAVARAGLEGFREELVVSANFRILYDHRFAARAYGERVAELLEAARGDAIALLGRGLERRLDVHLYTRGTYLESYQHRFGFATVGFYDGAIHVVAARQPRRELRALLAHEYAHAVFRDTFGSDRPFFLNEGIAEGLEERLRGRPQLSRGEWRRLLEAIRAEEWIPLASVVKGFSGLEGERALAAYLESRAAVELLEERRPGAVAAWLARCASGASWESALAEVTGFDVAGLDAALRADVTARFPNDPLARVAKGGMQ